MRKMLQLIDKGISNTIKVTILLQKYEKMENVEELEKIVDYNNRTGSRR